MALAQARADETRILHLRKTFSAPRERVFRAWTEPELLVRWWGPKSMTIPHCAMDVREDGAWRTTMRASDGREFTVSGVYKEITPPERLVFTWGWESDGERGHETIVTIEFLARGEDTELVLTQETFADHDSRDRHEEGWSSTLDCLDEALSQGQIL